MKFGSIILAGGSSKRMGTHKALIKIKDLSFLEIIVQKHKTAGIEKPIVVIPDFLQNRVEELDIQDINTVVCSPPEKTPLESLRRGIPCLQEDVDCFIMHPIDFPLPKIKTIKMLMEAHIASKKEIVKPIYNKRSGHPIILCCSLIKEIMQGSSDIGLREVVRKDQGRVFTMATDDEGVIKNINTKEDLQAL